jgi:hypothetical protein
VRGSALAWALAALLASGVHAARSGPAFVGPPPPPSGSSGSGAAGAPPGTGAEPPGLPAPLARAQEAFVPVEVVVLQVSGPVVTLNRGADAGFARGDTVRVRAVGGGLLEGAIVSVGERDARMELFDLDPAVPPLLGGRGEVLVPADRAAAFGGAGVVDGAVDDPARRVPDHPPWEQPVGEWAPGTPLLAPVRSPTREERPVDVRGRLFGRAEFTDDNQGAGREFGRVWGGLDLEVTNALGKGGSFRVKGDVSHRHTLLGSTSSDTTLSRVQRLSYRLGGGVKDVRRVEFGRFLHSEFPQFGLLDGVEYVRRTSGGSRIGASVGGLPTDTDELETGDDFGAALFGRWVSSPEEELALGLAYQKSWHDGGADRDLVVTTADWIAGRSTSLRASALVDYYGSSALLKDEGFELTEAHASLDHRFGNGGGGALYGSYTGWPEVLRNDFPVPPPQTIADERVTRGGVRGWGRVTDGFDLHGRLERWSDTGGGGGNGELRGEFREVFTSRDQLSLALFGTDGSFSSGVGARARMTWWVGRSTVRASYELTEFEQEGFLGAQRELLQQLVRFNLDTRLFEELDLTVYADKRFGDEQDALSAGLRLQWRF